MLNNHYLGAFLRNFPENLRRLNDTTVGFDMVDKPDMEKAVFCRCVRDVPEVLGIPGTGAEWRLRKRDVMVVRYSAVRAWVEEGSVELI